ncbi:MAG: helix-turn-helix domain-containing protein [Oscillospiraceae bacterium]|nr:helix-turn-helix domain-containing protein [Oscillospiraceae bacterium]
MKGGDTNERIKKLRKSLDLTQAEFATRLGVKRNTVATYEMGRSQPSDAAIMLICREFNVNEEWLRTGRGEMFLELSRDDEIAAFVGDVLQNKPNDFRKRFIAMLSRLNSSDWEVLEKMARQMVGDAADQPDQDAIWEAEARAEAEEVYRQVLAEKRAEAGCSASPHDARRWSGLK